MLTSDYRNVLVAGTGLISRFRPKNGRYHNEERTADRGKHSNTELASSSFDTGWGEQGLRPFSGATGGGGDVAQGQPPGVDGDGFRRGRLRAGQYAGAAGAHGLRVEGAAGGDLADAFGQSCVPAVFADGGFERSDGGFLRGAPHRRHPGRLEKRAGTCLEVLPARPSQMDAAGSHGDVRREGPCEGNRPVGAGGDRGLSGGHNVLGGEHPFPHRLVAAARCGGDPAEGDQADPKSGLARAHAPGTGRLRHADEPPVHRDDAHAAQGGLAQSAQATAATFQAAFAHDRRACPTPPRPTGARLRRDRLQPGAGRTNHRADRPDARFGAGGDQASARANHRRTDRPQRREDPQCLRARRAGDRPREGRAGGGVRQHAVLRGESTGSDSRLGALPREGARRMAPIAAERGKAEHLRSVGADRGGRRRSGFFRHRGKGRAVGRRDLRRDLSAGSRRTATQAQGAAFRPAAAPTRFDRRAGSDPEATLRPAPALPQLRAPLPGRRVGGPRSQSLGGRPNVAKARETQKSSLTVSIF